MRHNSALPKSHVIYTIAVIGFIYTLHLVLPMYYSSSFLSIFASEKSVGIIYMLASLATILGFLIIPFFLRKAGNYVMTLWLILIQICLFYGLTITTDPIYLSILFIIQTAIIALIGFSLDVFLEVYSDTAHVGMIRGLYMTTMNSAWIIAPLIGSLILGASSDYRGVFVAALFMLFPLLYLIYKNFAQFKDPHYHHPSIWKTLFALLKDHDHSKLFIINIILQTFYAWMVVYSPIYLNTVIGFDWTEIGIIITIMLLPFPLIEWPLGRLADKKYGEKEIMTIGLGLLGLSTMALAGIVSTNVFVWAFALFLTRVGAASVEIMIETYFFKTVNAKDPNILGFFRITRSIAYFLAPLVTGFGLFFSKDQSVLFIILGVICLLAMIPSWKLNDTN